MFDLYVIPAAAAGGWRGGGRKVAAGGQQTILTCQLDLPLILAALFELHVSKGDFARYREANMVGFSQYYGATHQLNVLLFI